MTIKFFASDLNAAVGSVGFNCLVGNAHVATVISNYERTEWRAIDMRTNAVMVVGTEEQARATARNLAERIAAV